MGTGIYLMAILEQCRQDLSILKIRKKPFIIGLMGKWFMAGKKSTIAGMFLTRKQAL